MRPFGKIDYVHPEAESRHTIKTPKAFAPKKNRRPNPWFSRRLKALNYFLSAS